MRALDKREVDGSKPVNITFFTSYIISYNSHLHYSTQCVTIYQPASAVMHLDTTLSIKFQTSEVVHLTKLNLVTIHDLQCAPIPNVPLFLQSGDLLR